MEIHINEKYRITHDGNHNFIIEERKLIKSTKEGVDDRYEWKEPRYYGTLHGACIALIDVAALGSEAKSLEEVVEELRQLKDDIFNEFRKLREIERIWRSSETSIHTSDTKTT